MYLRFLANLMSLPKTGGFLAGAGVISSVCFKGVGLDIPRFIGGISCLSWEDI